MVDWGAAITPGSLSRHTLQSAAAAEQPSPNSGLESNQRETSCVIPIRGLFRAHLSLHTPVSFSRWREVSLPWTYEISSQSSSRSKQASADVQVDVQVRRKPRPGVLVGPAKPQSEGGEFLFRATERSHKVHRNGV